MENDTKLQIAKMSVRIATFITTTNVIMYALDKALPTTNMGRLAKVALFIGEAVIAESVGYQGAMFMDSLMSGEVMSNLFAGKNNWD